MITATLTALYKRDLQRLAAEIGAYKDENSIWKTDKQITNSAGNLCLHLIGNLNHFVGAQMGNSGYVRNRDLEFTAKHTPRAELLKMIEDTAAVVDKTIMQLSPEELATEHLYPVYEFPLSKAQLLFYLTTHLAYHLGQINYHRRLLDTGE